MNVMQAIYRKLMGRRMAYRNCFLGEDDKPHQDGQRVLADLAKFCRAFQSTAGMGKDGKIDPYAMAIAEGRREVLLRIQSHLNVDDADLREMAQQMASQADNH